MNNKLADSFGRTIEYIRISVTDRCDLRCVYCMPSGYNGYSSPKHWLTFDEIVRVAGAFAELGTKRVRLTGGEPLTRNNLTVLAKMISSINGINDLSMSTNGTKLARHAHNLYKSGVTRLNVSLDTLDPQLFHNLTGGGDLNKVIDGLTIAKSVGFSPIKINMVVMRGVNDHEVVSMSDFCMKHGFTLRFIETMPMGQAGRKAYSSYIPLDEVKERLDKQYSLLPSINQGGGPARYMRVSGSNLTIGFITPISQHFCETCNRVRLSVDGTLYMCVGNDHSYPLRNILRSNISDTELKEHITTAISLKPEKHHFGSENEQIIRPMSQTGG